MITFPEAPGRAARTALDRLPHVKSALRNALGLGWQARVAALGATRAPVVITDAYGIRVVVHPFDRAGARYHLRRVDDREPFRVMDHVLRAGDVVLDVGANVGVYSAHASRLVGPAGRVLAFEPVPETVGRFHETIAVNRARNVELIEAAVCDRSGTVVINVFDGAERSGWSSLGTHAMTTGEGEEITPQVRVDVRGERLDVLCAEAGVDHVRFCKVDVEGFEREVFAGASEMLRRHAIDVVAFEISDAPLVGEGGTPLEVFDALATHGYHIVRELGGTVVDPADENRRLLAEPGGRYLQNYFACVDPAVLR